MLAYLIRRLLSGVLLLVALTLLTYVVFYTIPVHPGCLVVPCGPHSFTTPEQLKAADHLVGADQPVLVQYGRFVWRLVRHGSLGHTFQGNQPVKSIIEDSLPATASLVLGGMALLLALSLPLAIFGALRPRSLLDRGILFVSLFGIALHPFVVGLILRNVFASRLHLAPSDGYCSLRTTLDPCSGPEQWFSHLALPWLTFALFFLPLYTRMLRSRLLEASNERHVLTARAKGASELRVVRAHLLRGALPPVLAMLAVDMGTAVTAAIYVETIFGMEGIGALTLNALSGEAGGYELPVIVGIVFTVAAAIVLLNLAADIGSALLDPRIRLRSSTGLVRLPQPVARVTSPIGRFMQRRPTVWTLRAAAAAGIGVLAFVIATGHHKRTTLLDLPAEARRTLQLSWSEKADVLGAAMRFRVRSVAVGRRSWIVSGEVTNSSLVGIQILPADPSGRVPAGAGFSLLVPAPSTAGNFANLRVLTASGIAPSPPKALKPGESWRGRFGGVGKLPRETTIYVGFGNFVPAGQKLEPRFGQFQPQRSTWTTQHSFVLR